MSDESYPITAVAKAAEETAKTGRALVEAGSDLASFVGKALGTVPEDTVGLLGGDHLHELRIRNLDKISRKTEEILRERGVEDPEPIGPKALLPALGAASEEIDETLQDMWATLLANAMDPNKDTSLQRVFIETLKQFEPIEAFVFEKIAQSEREAGLDMLQLRTVLTMRETQVFVTLDRLVDLEVLQIKGSGPARIYTPTPLGTELSLACTGNAPD